MKVALISDFRTVHAQKWANSIRIFVDEFFGISVSVNEDIFNYHIYNLDMINKSGIRIVTLLKKMRYILTSWIILNREKPDIIHVHFLRPDITIFSYFFYKNVIISVWGNDIIDDVKTSIFKNFFRKIALNKAKVVTATTKYLANETYKYIKNKEIYIIPFGIDLKRFNTENYIKNKNDIIHIAFVKHLTKKYGPHILVESVRYIKNNIIIHIAGEGDMKEELMNLINLYKFECIRLEGFINQEILPKFLSGIDIFVMPSIYNSETFGVAAVEAQAMGIPVIASNVGGVPEAVKDNYTGILIEPDNPKKLAEAIDLLIDDKILYKKLQQNCRPFVTKKFNWDKNVNAIKNLYEKML